MSFKKGKKITKHVAKYADFDLNNYNGVGKALKEPVPNIDKLPGSEIYKGEVDNNARIRIGRDRDPFGSGRYNRKEAFDLTKLKSIDVSGYSNYMGAGAIDLVVGSGAPYPVDHYDTEQGEKPAKLPPLYTTVRTGKLGKQKLGDGETNHPGILMDSARIYITQMGDIDKYFKIKQFGDAADKNPSSGIVIKADRVRMHSRRDIKIVAGGDVGTGMDSCGYALSNNGAVHLIANNGAAGPQQNLVLGQNLVKCINGIYEILQDNLEVLNNLVISQMKLNAAISPSIRVGGCGPTASDPLSLIGNCFKILADFKDLFNIWFNKYWNIPIVQQFGHMSPSQSGYILSRNNTTN